MVYKGHSEWDGGLHVHCQEWSSTRGLQDGSA